MSHKIQNKYDVCCVAKGHQIELNKYHKYCQKIVACCTNKIINKSLK